jgi:hypothetical protein
MTTDDYRFMFAPDYGWTDSFGPLYVVDEIELGFRAAQWLIEENI